MLVTRSLIVGPKMQIGFFRLIPSLAKLFSALSLVSVLAFAQPAVSQEEDSEQTHERNSDFVLRVKVHVLDHFLVYKGSKLYPVASADVTYKVKDLKSQQFLETKPYEELWFHNNHAIGCLRHEELPLRAGTHGAMIIENTNDLRMQLPSVSNAIVRLLLDTHLKDANVTVFAPIDGYAQLSSEMASLHFHETKTLSSNQRGILLHIESVPRKYDDYFCFDVQ